MGWPPRYPAWLVLRFAAGVASACVLVGVSAWALAALGARGRAGWSGGVFSGVGIGIALAGVAGLVAGVAARAAGSGLAAARRDERGGAPRSRWRAAARRCRGAGARRRRRQRDAGRATGGLIAGYGAFGFGYIIPATFLPAMAREAIADPAVFGWIWPAFGAAAAASTRVVARLLARLRRRRLWAASLLLMARGVLAPALRPGVASLLVAAVCVGGTFMVATLAGHAGGAAPAPAPARRA